MDILLFNPLSRNGNNPKFIDKITKQLNKLGHDVEHVNILDVEDVEAFVKSRHKDDRIILVGGDGTLNHIANRIYGLTYPQDLYMYQAGTGNDFIRSLKTKEKVVFIKPYLEHLPKVSFNNESRYFINGVGLGLDGLVIHFVSHSKYKKNKFNYFRHALEGFRKFKPVSGTFTIDGKSYEEKKIWFISALNAPFQGGGMKMAPQANREEKNLDLLVITKLSRFLLFLIFPTIYMGKHTIFKKYVKIYKGNDFEVHFDRPTYLQIDGESKADIKDIKISSAK
jgi:diacylglycerol kinase family enzyme